MKCMCAQTRPRFILSSEGIFGGIEFELMLTRREKSPLPENVPRGGSNPRHCGQRAQALPTELFRPPGQGINTVSRRDFRTSLCSTMSVFVLPTLRALYVPLCQCSTGVCALSLSVYTHVPNPKLVPSPARPKDFL